MTTTTTLPKCACGCGRDLPPRKATGRPRRYATEACKSRAARERSSAPSWTAGQVLAEPPADPLTHRRRTLEATDEYLAGAAPGAPEDQLARCITEITQITFTLRRLAPELHAGLGPRAAQAAIEIDAVIRRTFPTEDS